jgi:hypothetical protein
MPAPPDPDLPSESERATQDGPEVESEAEALEAPGDMEPEPAVDSELEGIDEPAASETVDEPPLESPLEPPLETLPYLPANAPGFEGDILL